MPPALALAAPVNVIPLPAGIAVPTLVLFAVIVITALVTLARLYPCELMYFVGFAPLLIPAEV